MDVLVLQGLRYTSSQWCTATLAHADCWVIHISYGWELQIILDSGSKVS